MQLQLAIKTELGKTPWKTDISLIEPMQLLFHIVLKYRDNPWASNTKLMIDAKQIKRTHKAVVNGEHNVWLGDIHLVISTIIKTSDKKSSTLSIAGV